MPAHKALAIVCSPPLLAQPAPLAFAAAVDVRLVTVPLPIAAMGRRASIRAALGEKLAVPRLALVVFLARLVVGKLLVAQPPGFVAERVAGAVVRVAPLPTFCVVALGLCAPQRGDGKGTGWWGWR